MTGLPWRPAASSDWTALVGNPSAYGIVGASVGGHSHSPDWAAAS